MEKLIFNEKLYVEELLRIHDITQCDISVFKLIHYLTIYYHQVYGITDKYKLAEMINQELQGFNIFEYLPSVNNTPLSNSLICLIEKRTTTNTTNNNITIILIPPIYFSLYYM